MKYDRKFWLAIIIGTIITAALISCSKDDKEPIVSTPIEDIFTDPFYNGVKNMSLNDLWVLFRNDAIRSGKLDPGIGQEVHIRFGGEPDFASGITSDHAGRSYSHCIPGLVRFDVIKSFWEDFTDVEKLYTFYHEAGHARYRYRHPCESGEQCDYTSDDSLPIMWASTQNATLEKFVEDKNNFFRQDWKGIRYFRCE